jgi:hypothetical protein
MASGDSGFEVLAIAAAAELERAIAIDPGLRERAETDEAFAAIRGRDDWPAR